MVYAGVQLHPKKKKKSEKKEKRREKTSQENQPKWPQDHNVVYK